MLRRTIAVIPVFLSSRATQPEILFRYAAGKVIAASSKINMINNSGANAWVWTAVCQLPLSSIAMAVVKPHPGHVTPKVDRIGHCQPVNPVVVSANWATPTPVKIKRTRLFCSSGAMTGVKNHFNPSETVDLPAAAVFCGCPYAGLYDSAILVIRTCNFMLRSAWFWFKLSAFLKKALQICLKYRESGDLGVLFGHDLTGNRWVYRVYWVYWVDWVDWVSALAYNQWLIP